MARCRAPLGVVLVSLLGVLAGCSSTSTHASGGSDFPTVSPTSVPAPTTTTSTVPGRDPSPGCTAAGGRVAPGQTKRSLTVAGVAHPYLLSIPSGYRPAQPTPLVLMFHGFGEDGAAFASLTRMPTEGARAGVIVVTPDGPNHTWQLSGTGSDASFVDAIVAGVSETLCVDMHRIYAAGFSQGAAFAIFYSCVREDRIAAIATVAVDFQLGCAQPVPYLAFHGTNDPAVPYTDGAVGASLPGAVRGTLLNMSDWAKLDACNPTAVTRPISSEVTLRTWSRCSAGSAVELYTIINGSHTWPGADPKASPLYTTKQIDATALMLGFFARHYLGSG